MEQPIWALKEWAIAVDALLSGDLMLLIRKGGIRETKPYFEVPSDRVLLFPTYEHQKPAAIRAPFVDRFEKRAVPQAGDTMEVPGWAEITHQLSLVGDSIVPQLRPFHIWTDAWLTERLAWKPARPAYALLLRVHQFSEPVELVYQKPYGGCRSWLALKSLETLPESAPVLMTSVYEQRVDAIQQAIVPVTT